jgi:hypothetical protein
MPPEPLTPPFSVKPTIRKSITFSIGSSENINATSENPAFFELGSRTNKMIIFAQYHKSTFGTYENTTDNVFPCQPLSRTSDLKYLLKFEPGDYSLCEILEEGFVVYYPFVRFRSTFEYGTAWVGRIVIAIIVFISISFASYLCFRNLQLKKQQLDQSKTMPTEVPQKSYSQMGVKVVIHEDSNRTISIQGKVHRAKK